MFRLAFTGSRASIKLRGKAIPGAEDRQINIAGFNQNKYSQSHVLCIGAGGLISAVAPTLVRKGIGALTILDPDVVEASNLNRQLFYSHDIGKPKALALVRNLSPQCIHSTELVGHAVSLQTALYRHIDLSCDLVLCGVDNNEARVTAARAFRELHIPVIFMGVSAEADHGYVFIQRETGPCLGCVFPDIAGDHMHPCPNTPAIADVLHLVGALASFAVDAVLTNRRCEWNYRSEYLHDGEWSVAKEFHSRVGCAVVASH
jgi:molybdopterin/thiamine biosynthesis adenylyltransferase